MHCHISPHLITRRIDLTVKSAFTLLSLSLASTLMRMKTVPLTVRRCPAKVHQALKDTARSNRRSLNAEVLIRLEEQARSKPVSAAETARILRQLDKTLTSRDRKQLVAGIDEARLKMAHEHLH
jgi:hypothetical protein